MIHFNKFISEYDGKSFVIEEDTPEVGAYLYVYVGDKCVYDYLQDTVEICKEFAFEKYLVPLNSWEKD